MRNTFFSRYASRSNCTSGGSEKRTNGLVYELQSDAAGDTGSSLSASFNAFASCGLDIISPQEVRLCLVNHPLMKLHHRTNPLLSALLPSALEESEGSALHPGLFMLRTDWTGLWMDALDTTEISVPTGS
jgi:hypothetical protein